MGWFSRKKKEKEEVTAADPAEVLIDTLKGQAEIAKLHSDTLSKLTSSKSPVATKDGTYEKAPTTMVGLDDIVSPMKTEIGGIRYVHYDPAISYDSTGIARSKSTITLGDERKYTSKMIDKRRQFVEDLRAIDSVFYDYTIDKDGDYIELTIVSHDRDVAEMIQSRAGDLYRGINTSFDPSSLKWKIRVYDPVNPKESEKGTTYLPEWCTEEMMHYSVTVDTQPDGPMKVTIEVPDATLAEKFERHLHKYFNYVEISRSGYYSCTGDVSFEVRATYPKSTEFRAASEKPSTPPLSVDEATKEAFDKAFATIDKKFPHGAKSGPDGRPIPMTPDELSEALDRIRESVSKISFGDVAEDLEKMREPKPVETKHYTEDDAFEALEAAIRRAYDGAKKTVKIVDDIPMSYDTDKSGSLDSISFPPVGSDVKHGTDEIETTAAPGTTVIGADGTPWTVTEYTHDAVEAALAAAYDEFLANSSEIVLRFLPRSAGGGYEEQPVLVYFDKDHNTKHIHIADYADFMPTAETDLFRKLNDEYYSFKMAFGRVLYVRRDCLIDTYIAEVDGSMKLSYKEFILDKRLAIGDVYYLPREIKDPHFKEELAKDFAIGFDLE